MNSIDKNVVVTIPREVYFTGKDLTNINYFTPNKKYELIDYCSYGGQSAIIINDKGAKVFIMFFKSAWLDNRYSWQYNL